MIKENLRTSILKYKVKADHFTPTLHWCEPLHLEIVSLAGKSQKKGKFDQFYNVLLIHSIYVSYCPVKVMEIWGWPSRSFKIKVKVILGPKTMRNWRNLLSYLEHRC